MRSMPATRSGTGTPKRRAPHTIPMPSMPTMWLSAMSRLSSSLLLALTSLATLTATCWVNLLLLMALTALATVSLHVSKSIGRPRNSLRMLHPFSHSIGNRHPFGQLWTELDRLLATKDISPAVARPAAATVRFSLVGSLPNPTGNRTDTSLCRCG